MAIRSGSADLPLHGGKVPEWLAARMANLGRVITEAIVFHYGREEFLRRLSHPFWFQSFGAVMGMDWHSSGLTTSVMGALKRGLAPVSQELGLFVCGGRGRHSRKTPDELLLLGDRLGLDGNGLVHTSRLVAKVDSAAVQDGFALYLHSFVLAADGLWTVIQQGMNGGRRQARRYHCLSEGLNSFVDEPHTAIEGPAQGTIINLTDHRAAAARNLQVELVHQGPDKLLNDVRQAVQQDTSMASVVSPNGPIAYPDAQLHLQLPHHHAVVAEDIVLRRLHGALRAAAERGPRDFTDLLMTPGVGARTVQALALVSEVIHGAPCRFADPARFSYAHGGKDGHPFPVPLNVVDETLRTLRVAVQRAKLGNDDKLAAIKKLDDQAHRLETLATGKSFADLISHERRMSHTYGGMTVKDRPQNPRPKKAATKASKKRAPSSQLTLPGLSRRRH